MATPREKQPATPRRGESPRGTGSHSQLQADIGNVSLQSAEADLSYSNSPLKLLQTEPAVETDPSKHCTRLSPCRPLDKYFEPHALRSFQRLSDLATCLNNGCDVILQCESYGDTATLYFRQDLLQRHVPVWCQFMDPIELKKVDANNFGNQHTVSRGGRSTRGSVDLSRGGSPSATPSRLSSPRGQRVHPPTLSVDLPADVSARSRGRRGYSPALSMDLADVISPRASAVSRAASMAEGLPQLPGSFNLAEDPYEVAPLLALLLDLHTQGTSDLVAVGQLSPGLLRMATKYDVRIVFSYMNRRFLYNQPGEGLALVTSAGRGDPQALQLCRQLAAGIEPSDFEGLLGKLEEELRKDAELPPGVVPCAGQEAYCSSISGRMLRLQGRDPAKHSDPYLACYSVL